MPGPTPWPPNTLPHQVGPGKKNPLFFAGYPWPQVQTIPDLGIGVSDSTITTESFPIVAGVGGVQDFTPINWSETINVILGNYNVAVLDTTATADADTALLESQVAALDTTATADADVAIEVSNVAALDTATTAESISVRLDCNVVDLDTVTTSESVTAVETGGAPPDDNVSITVETVTTAEFVSAPFPGPISALDTVTTTEGVTVRLECFVQTLDTATTAETAIAAIQMAVAALDTTATSESAIAAIQVSVAALDTATTSESVSAPFPGPVAVLDTVTTAESAKALGVLLVSVLDATATAESVSAPFPGPVGALDTITTAESASAPFPGPISALDTVTTAESILVTSAATSLVSITETVTTTEFVSAPFPGPVAALDTTATSEGAVGLVPILLVATAETTTTAETVKAPFPGPVAAADSATTADAAQGLVPVLLATALDAAATHETVAAPFPGPVSALDTVAAIDQANAAFIVTQGVLTGDLTVTSDHAAVFLVDRLFVSLSEALTLGDHTVERIMSRQTIRRGSVRPVQNAGIVLDSHQLAKKRAEILARIKASAPTTTPTIPPPPPPIPSLIIQDTFDRPNGLLGSNWTDSPLGGLRISSNAATGKGGRFVASVRTGENYPGDQWSEIDIPTAIPGGSWIGATVRSDDLCETFYLAMYYNDVLGTNGYRVTLFRQINEIFLEIANQIAPFAPGPIGWVPSEPLLAGDTLRLSAVGDTILVYVNGIRVLKVIDDLIPPGGAPGVAAFGLSNTPAWRADAFGAIAEPAAPFHIFTGSPPNSPRNGGNHHIRVLVPDPNLVTPNISHNFLYALPVDADGVYNYGNPLDTLYGLNIHNRYNVTIIEPNFAIGSWYANHTTDPTLQHETFMVSDLAPWVTANWSLSGHEEHWVLGFSRAGFGGATLLFKHPTAFAHGTFWDWPFDMTIANYGGYGAGTGVYGSDANFVTNYQMTQSYLDAHKAPFQTTNRIWIGGHVAFQADVHDADVAFANNGMLHTTDADILRGHTWSSGWIEAAITELYLRKNPSDPAANPPVNLTVPQISGNLIQGSALTCSRGTWTNNPYKRFQWQIDDGLGSFGDIAGATANQYVTQMSDIGFHIRCNVLAYNSFGSASVIASAVGPILVRQVFTDDFNRPDGDLGPNWNPFDTPMVIESGQVRGDTPTGDGGISGNWSTTETYPDDHYSQIETTGAAIGLQDWIGVAVRIDSLGQNLYLAIYFNNASTYVLRLYVRIDDAFTQLLTEVPLGASPLPPGTVLKLSAVADAITLYQDGTPVIATSDFSVLGDGAPGIMSAGNTAFADNWTGS